MKYKNFGNTGLKVSSLSFGTMTFGGEADEATSLALYKRCREAGINLFDSANIYHEGRSEELLGKFIKGERAEVIITSKVYFPTGKDENAKGLSRKNITLALEQSLKRLNTDYIDIYFMHRFDETTPLEESLNTMTDLVKQSKIHYLGVSNFAAWQIMKGLGISEALKLAKFVCLQPMYNLVKRQAEVEIFPMAISEKLAVIPYNPLGGGLLTGKYSKTASHASQEGRLKNNKMYQLRYGDEEAQLIADQFVEFARKEGYSPVSLAIAWAANHPAVTSPLLGARNLQQLDECLKALDIHMTPDLRNKLSAVSKEPPLATDRSDELVQVGHAVI